MLFADIEGIEASEYNMDKPKLPGDDPNKKATQFRYVTIKIGKNSTSPPMSSNLTKRKIRNSSHQH